MQCDREALHRRSCSVSIPQAVWTACNVEPSMRAHLPAWVSIPQAVWTACNPTTRAVVSAAVRGFNTASGMDCMQLVSLDEIRYAFPTFQYRKRYGLHAIGWTEIATPFTDSVSIPQAVWTACNAQQYGGFPQGGYVSIPQAVWTACNFKFKNFPVRMMGSFNTASGMDCMQSPTIAFSGCSSKVSIPQAVWTACNTVSQNP